MCSVVSNDEKELIGGKVPFDDYAASERASKHEIPRKRMFSNQTLGESNGKGRKRWEMASIDLVDCR